MSKLLPYLIPDTDCRGNVRFYVRKRGFLKKRIHGAPGTKLFLDAYQAALETLIPLGTVVSDDRPKKPEPKTLAWLVQQYSINCHDFKQLDPRSQRKRISVLEACCAETRTPESKDTFGPIPLEWIEAKHLRVMRDRKESTPTAANERLIFLKAMFGWAVENEHMKRNVALDVKSLKHKTEGHHTWTREEVAAFEAKHPLGTTERLALALMLYTGVRRSDAALLGPQHIVERCLVFRPFKTRNTTKVILTLPILPVLQKVMDASTLGKDRFLMTKLGHAFRADWLGEWFKQACKDAGLPHCTPHGLRKAGATLAAENGATTSQLKAIFGWASSEQPDNYTKKANNKTLAGRGMHLLSDERS